MSQRGPGSHASHRSSPKSPTRSAQASPLSIPSGLHIRGETYAESRRDADVIPGSNGEEFRLQTTPRMSGVHDILNPSESQGSSIGGASGTGQKRSGAELSPSIMAAGRYEAGPSPGLDGQTPLQPETAGLLGRLSSVSSPQFQRASPTIAHPLPALGVPRRILTPKSPLPRALSRETSYRSSDAQSPFSAPPVRVEPPQPDVRLPHGPSPGSLAQFATSPAGIGVSSTLAPFATPPRSLSQPLLGHIHPASQAPQQSRMLGIGTRDTPGRSILGSGTAFQPGLPPGRGLSSPRLGVTGQWQQQQPPPPPPPPPLGGQMGSRSFSISEGQQFLTIHPDVGDAIHVPVDVHQASRQADEKRQRNAGASARFRARKKERERDIQNVMQRLESQNRELQDQLRAMEIQRDYYRSERNRLRDIVYRTPNIQEQADQGPPSPASHSAGSFAAENSPMTTSSHPVPLSSHTQSAMPTYISDPSPLERPARRRRIDTAPEFTTPSYGPPPTSITPPILEQGYGIAPTADPRLPPLRMDQPTGLPEAPGLLPPQPQQPGSPGHQPHQLYRSNTRGPYETGWATETSGQHGPGQR